MDILGYCEECLKVYRLTVDRFSICSRCKLATMVNYLFTTARPDSRELMLIPSEVIICWDILPVIADYMNKINETLYTFGCNDYKIEWNYGLQMTDPHHTEYLANQRRLTFMNQSWICYSIDYFINIMNSEGNLVNGSGRVEKYLSECIKRKDQWIIDDFMVFYETSEYNKFYIKKVKEMTKYERDVISSWKPWGNQIMVKDSKVAVSNKSTKASYLISIHELDKYMRNDYTIYDIMYIKPTGTCEYCIFNV